MLEKGKRYRKDLGGGVVAEINLDGSQTVTLFLPLDLRAPDTINVATRGQAKGEVTLEFAAQGGGAQFDNLYGNGWGSGFQGLGLGTLVVNLGIQVMHKFCDPEDPVRTKAADPRDTDITDPEARAMAQLRRETFWRRFFPEPQTESRNRHGDLVLATTVGKLALQDGTALNGLPRILSLADFYPVSG